MSEDKTGVEINGTYSAGDFPVVRVEVSFDSGLTWFLSTLLPGNKFKLTKNKLEDGTYPAIARAIDSKGNIGTSNSNDFTIDLLPPLLGGANISLGPLFLNANENGLIDVSANVEMKLTISTRGGVTETEAVIGEKIFSLKRITGTTIWQGKINFLKTGINSVVINAKDGTGKITSKTFDNFFVQQLGTIKDKNSGEMINSALVSAYFFDNITKSWVLLDSKAFEQKNPISVEKGIGYSFLLPVGKYYLEAKASGYKTAQSEIFILDKTSPVNMTFSLSPSRNPLGPFLPPDNIEYKNLKDNEVVYKKSLIGKKVPSVSAETTDGKIFSFSNTLGRGTLVTFITSWSPESANQALILEAVQKLKKDKNIVAIFTQEPTNKVSTYMRRGDYKFIAVSDENGTVSNDFGTTILPYHVFIDSSGIVKSVSYGIKSQNELISSLNKLE